MTDFAQDVVEHGKMGVSVCAVDRLSGITYSVGKHKVVNTGIDAMRMQPPAGVSIPSFVESLMHKASGRLLLCIIAKNYRVSSSRRWNSTFYHQSIPKTSSSVDFAFS